MSIEPLVISAIVEEGKTALRKLYTEGIGQDDFINYEEEFKWIEQMVSDHRPISPRSFRQKFPDFDWSPGTESLKDLLPELKRERVFVEVNNVAARLVQVDLDNALQLSGEAIENLLRIHRIHGVDSEELMDGDVEKRMKMVKQGLLLAKQGAPTGIQTDIPHLDFHWGGLVNGRMYVILGRPGSGKSMVVAKFAWAAQKYGYRVGLFSPEMSAHEHTCRVHTLASAEKHVQKHVGLQRSFRNRALMELRGFNPKQYQRFLEYMSALPGGIHILSGRHRKTKMTVQYIAQKVEDLGLDLVLIDPIYKLRQVRRRGSQWEELGELSDAVQDLAEQYNIPVVITNQAHRQGGASGDAPHKDRSFGSDVPIQNADHVLGVLHQSEEHRLICRCTKSRFGQDFSFEMELFVNTGLMRPVTPLPKHSNYNGSDDPTQDELKEMVVGALTGKVEA